MHASEGEFSALVEAHSKWLSAFLRGLTRSEADAEDVFQEVWLRLLKRPLVNKISSERAYLASVARSVVIDRFRKEGRTSPILDEPDADGDSMADALPDADPTPDERVERVATHEEVLAAVRSLKPAFREVVLMRIEGELSFQEIADVLGVPLGTVLARMRRATERLKKILRRA